uniref:Uncharacterized protein n=1 Tax=Tetranychus urticae TaxID=32264 RepID=T1KP77_TETUR
MLRCDAYQVLRNHGVPAENIVMMYDDIAKGKKVLTSGSNDHISIYFAHGLIGFPNGILSSNDLNKDLVYMHNNKIMNLS